MVGTPHFGAASSASGQASLRLQRSQREVTPLHSGGAPERKPWSAHSLSPSMGWTGPGSSSQPGLSEVSDDPGPCLDTA